MQRRPFALLACTTISLVACSPEGTTITTAITTSATAPITDPTAPLTATDSDTEPTPTTGDDSTSTSTTSGSTSTTSPGDWSCLAEDFDCGRVPTAASSFCEYLATECPAHDIEPIYCTILAGKCDDPIRCDACFYLELVCSQVGTDCANLMAECACVAEVAP